MKKSLPARSPDAYVAALTGWRRKCVEQLRDTVRAAATLEEVVKWGHLVYRENGPVLLIRAEEERVLLGFWRGQRLRAQWRAVVLRGERIPRSGPSVRTRTRYAAEGGPNQVVNASTSPT